MRKLLIKILGLTFLDDKDGEIAHLNRIIDALRAACRKLNDSLLMEKTRSNDNAEYKRGYSAGLDAKQMQIKNFIEDVKRSERAKVYKAIEELIPKTK